MPDLKPSMLIVEDEDSVRSTLAEIFRVLGHRVRSASNGLEALIELRKEIPVVLLSDLYMPGMSGFELLSIVRRRFPEVRVIAMSGAFSGYAVPCGVTADDFYEKGSGMVALLTAIGRPPFTNLRNYEAPEPIWIQKKRAGYDGNGVCNDRVSRVFQNFSAADQRDGRFDNGCQLYLLPQRDPFRSGRDDGCKFSSAFSACSALRGSSHAD